MVRGRFDRIIWQENYTLDTTYSWFPKRLHSQYNMGYPSRQAFFKKKIIQPALHLATKVL